MQALWRAILMDPEARAPSNVRDTQYGKAKEPLLRFNSMIRALNGRATSLRYRFTDFSNPNNALGQSPYRAPTVFNYYDPDYVPEGAFQAANKVAPELQILTTSSAVGANNFLQGLVYNGTSGVGGAATDRVNLDYSTLLPLATTPAVLIDRLNFVLLGGRMSLHLRQVVQKAIEAMPAATLANQTDRVKAAIYLLTPTTILRRAVASCARCSGPRPATRRRSCSTSTAWPRSRRPAAATRRSSACSCTAGMTATT
jgi:Protein of unknown function (DUF1800)